MYIPNAVLELMERLEEAGFETWVVGGCVGTVVGACVAGCVTG